METKAEVTTKAHEHLWIVGLFGILVGLLLMVVAPRLQVIAGSMILFAGFHLLGALVILASAAYWKALGSSKPMRNLGDKVDYGWGPGWMNGLALVSFITFSLAILIQATTSAWWPVTFLLVLQSAIFAAGSGVVTTFRRHGYAVLPLAPLLHSKQDRVLDIGCGAGRTTLALDSLLPEGTITALDRFNASYIQGGGMALLENNLRIRGMQGRVQIQAGDITSMPFEANTFDSAVSTAVFDHLGASKQKGLDEAYRVLKPGSRFLMSLWVPSWPVFAVGNVFSFMLSPKSAWRRMAAKAGFELIEEGFCNFSWYVLLQKPGNWP